MKHVSLSSIVGALLISATSLTAQTLWIGASGGDWQADSNWQAGSPSQTNAANFSVAGDLVVEVSSPAKAQGIQKGGHGSVTLNGSALTLGSGYNDSFNSILVNAGSLEINNDLVNTANKRLTLNAEGSSLSLNGAIDTRGITMQIGNLGSGKLSFAGHRSGGNTVIFRDGVIHASGILSNTGGGSTTVMANGTLVSMRTHGPSIEGGSAGLVINSSGTFRLAADNQIAGFLNLNGGTLDLDASTNEDEKIGNMTLSADSVIDFSDPAKSGIVFGDLSGNTSWNATATLKITGFTAGDSLRFATNANGLTPAQLKQISFDGKPAQIDASGFVTSVK